MKHKFLLLTFSLGFSLVYAQRNSDHYNIQLKENVAIDFERVVDTVTIPTPNAACIPNAAVGILSLGNDMVSGTNGFGDKEKAQMLTYTGGGSVQAVLAFFGAKYVGGAAGTTNYTVKVYGGGLASGPGALLGTSQNVGYTAIDTTGNATLFTFASPVAVTDTFFVSVVVDPGTTGVDTVGVLTLFDGNNPTNSCGNNTAWEKQADNSWHLMNGSTAAEWGVDVEFLTGAIINTGVAGIDESSLITHKVYPNPASDMVNISYVLAEPGDVQIQVVDMTGKVLSASVYPNSYSGAYNQVLDVTGYASGFYTYVIGFNNQQIEGKFLVK